MARSVPTQGAPWSVPLLPTNCCNARAAPRARANVREAVRDLTLHALRSRLLTATHIATVARTVGEGIESSDVPPTAPVRETHRGAWAGLEDAVGQALHAVELAAREFAEGRARLTPAERDQLLAEIAQLERSLGEGWGYPRTVPRVPAGADRRGCALTCGTRSSTRAGRVRRPAAPPRAGSSRASRAACCSACRKRVPPDGAAAGRPAASAS